MKSNANTGVEEREQWRARLEQALQELHGEGIIANLLRRDADQDRANDSAE
jgi:hypothetical protein